MPKKPKAPELDAVLAQATFAGREWGQQYIRSLERAGERRKASSRRAYEAVWRSYLRFLAGRGLNGASASAEAARAFLRATEHPTTRLRYGRLLEAIYDHAVARGDAKANPFAQLEKLLSEQEERSPVPVIAIPSVQALIDALPPAADWKEHRDQAMVVLGAAAGLRLRELRELEVYQLSGDTVQPKGSTVRSRVLDLPAPAKHFLRDWLTARRESGLPGLLAFPGNAGNKVPVTTLYRRVRRVLQGICGDEGLEHYGVGILRAFFAKSFRKPVHAQYGLGHRRLTSTLRYLKQMRMVSTPRAKDKLQKH